MKYVIVSLGNHHGHRAYAVWFGVECPNDPRRVLEPDLVGVYATLRAARAATRPTK